MSSVEYNNNTFNKQTNKLSFLIFYLFHNTKIKCKKSVFFNILFSKNMLKKNQQLHPLIWCILSLRKQTLVPKAYFKYFVIIIIVNTNLSHFFNMHTKLRPQNTSKYKQWPSATAIRRPPQGLLENTDLKICCKWKKV